MSQEAPAVEQCGHRAAGRDTSFLDAERDFPWLPSNRDIQPCNRLQDEPLVRRHLCICICVHNAERLSLLMKVEHARAIAIMRKDYVKRAHKHNPARTKLFRQSCLCGSQ